MMIEPLWPLNASIVLSPVYSLFRSYSSPASLPNDDIYLFSCIAAHRERSFFVLTRRRTKQISIKNNPFRLDNGGDVCDCGDGFIIRVSRRFRFEQQ